MSRTLVQRFCVLAASLCLATGPVLQVANAAIIQTGAAIEITERQHQIDRINDVLARDSVRDVMIGLGVDPADANVRVRSLTSEELRTLDKQLANLPAGGVGVVEVIGIVAIVLIILELVGVTNIFNSF